jgi:hypothetical protein
MLAAARNMNADQRKDKKREDTKLVRVAWKTNPIFGVTRAEEWSPLNSQ